MEVFVVFRENCSMYVSIGDRGRAGIYTIIICTNRNKGEHYGYHTQLDKEKEEKTPEITRKDKRKWEEEQLD